MTLQTLAHLDTQTPMAALKVENIYRFLFPALLVVSKDSGSQKYCFINQDLKIHLNSLAGINQRKTVFVTPNTCSTVQANHPIQMIANRHHLLKKQ